ncbi:hypothetical protein AB0L63_09455 [Nocardia sp. NPDC051990]|uniref:hypothetical protein n=1 Tax=Nocardia sp. NPDC051990 TaxID=3155285 RepID=UPI003422E126
MARLQWDGGIAAAVDPTLLGRYYERFADHTVQVGVRTIFMSAGESFGDWSSSAGE